MPSPSKASTPRFGARAHGHDLETVQWFEDAETGVTLTRSGLNGLQEGYYCPTPARVKLAANLSG